jgi:hypothetical protein
VDKKDRGAALSYTVEPCTHIVAVIVRVSMHVYLLLEWHYESAILAASAASCSSRGHTKRGSARLPHLGRAERGVAARSAVCRAKRGR